VKPDDLRDDPLYPRIARAVAAILVQPSSPTGVARRPSSSSRGKGPRRRLRFARTGDPNVEEAYSMCFVRPGKGPFHPPGDRCTLKEDPGSGGRADIPDRLG
jgi:hypothetical protein